MIRQIELDASGWKQPSDFYDALLPELIGRYTEDLGSRIDIEKMVTEKVAGYSSDKLEEILQSVMKKEFWFLEIVAFVLGFLIGLIQMLLSLL